MMISRFDALPEMTAAEVTAALKIALAQVKNNLPAFTHQCQNHTSIKNFYPPCENNQWTCGFWPGEIWLAYELTREEDFAKAGAILVESFAERIQQKIEVDHHDMGFLYTPSCVSAYRLTGNQKARKAALLAAKQLLTRYHTIGGFLQAWGALGAADNYRFIIDCLMNLPLLYWASEETGDDLYRKAALKHTETCLKYSIREDGSTFHTVFMDPVTGSMTRGVTCQGYSNDSFWARGQAWAVYGTALCFRYTKNPEAADAFVRVLDFYLSKLPQDMVPYWDMIFTEGENEPRDSSSASIAACGLLEMAALVPSEQAARYRSLAKRMMKSLAEQYAVKDPRLSNGLVLHSTYSKKSPFNTCTPEGVDECSGWGDYFYLEGLTRLHSTDWKPYW